MENTASIKPLGPERTVEQRVVRELRELIIEGRLDPGTRLRLRTLAGGLDVSVTPVRIALRELAKEGLVELRQSGALYVSELSVEELEEVYASRTGLESRLARLGAPLLTDAQLGDMEARFEQVQRAAQADDRAAYVDSALHYRMKCYEAAERPRMLATVETLIDRSRRYSGLTLGSAERLGEALDLAGVLREACLARDGVKAQAAVRATLDRSLEYLLTRIPLSTPPNVRTNESA